MVLRFREPILKDLAAREPVELTRNYLWKPLKTGPPTPQQDPIFHSPKTWVLQTALPKDESDLERSPWC